MSITPGRFSEFMVNGALTEPETLNPVYDEKAGIEQNEAIPEGADLTTATPTPQENQQGITPDSLLAAIWPILQGASTGKGPTPKIPGQYSAFDGSRNLALELPNNAPIRSLWIPIASGVPFGIFSGTATGGGAIFTSNGRVTGVISIPDGNPNLTLVPTGKFAIAVPVFATSEVLAPNLQNNSSDFPIGATPFTADFTGTSWSSGSSGSSANLPSSSIGQRIYISNIAVSGIDRQSIDFLVTAFDSSHATIAFLEHYHSGKDFNRAFSPPLQSSPLAHNGVPTIQIESTTDSTAIIGDLLFDAIVTGYIL